MADREARRAGAMSSNRSSAAGQGRAQEPLRPEPVDSRRPNRGGGGQVKVQTVPHAKAVRIVREGNPLESGPRKPVTSPAVQEIPKRRNQPSAGTSVGR